MKMNFEYFQMQKWMLQTVRAKIIKIDKNNGAICLVFMFPLFLCLYKTVTFHIIIKKFSFIFLFSFSSRMVNSNGGLLLWKSSRLLLWKSGCRSHVNGSLASDFHYITFVIYMVMLHTTETTPQIWN